MKEKKGIGDMNSELYVKKASMQLKKGDIDGAACSMKKVVERNDDVVALVQAHCFLGEYYFVNRNYALAKEHLDYILQQEEELENEYDDLLNYEMINANVLEELIYKFLLA